MPPDVTIVSPYPDSGVRHGGYSGVASYCANLVEALSGAGAEICVVAPRSDGGDHETTDGAVRVLRRADRGASTLTDALRTARGTGAPVVHVQHELFLYGGPATIPAQLAALRRHRRAPGARRTVLTMHQVVASRTIDAAYVQMHRIAFPAPVARAALGALQAALPTLVDQVVVHEAAFREVVPSAVTVPHGLEVPPVAAGDSLHAKRALGLPEDRLVALCFGFLAPYKGLPTALDAARLAGDAVLLVVAGGDHPRLAQQGDPYGAHLRDGYEDIARFPGYVADDDVAGWFRAADVALFPYPQPHAASGALALALAYGTPSLLSPALGALVNAPPALVVAASAADLADRLRLLASDPRQLQELREQTAELAHGRSWPDVARRHLDIYEGFTRDEQDPSRGRLRAA